MNKTKTRSLKSENRSFMLMNFGLLIILATVLWLTVPLQPFIGIRNELILNFMFSCGIMCFTTALEKYSVIISGIKEKFVINVLSTLYTFICMCIVNLLLFNKAPKYASI